MTPATFISNSANTTTFRILADNATQAVVDLIAAIQSKCTPNLSGSCSTTSSAYNDSLNSLAQPDQAIQ